MSLDSYKENERWVKYIHPDQFHLPTRRTYFIGGTLRWSWNVAIIDKIEEDGDCADEERSIVDFEISWSEF